MGFFAPWKSKAIKLIICYCWSIPRRFNLSGSRDCITLGYNIVFSSLPANLLFKVSCDVFTQQKQNYLRLKLLKSVFLPEKWLYLLTDTWVISILSLSHVRYIFKSPAFSIPLNNSTQMYFENGSASKEITIVVSSYRSWLFL